MLFFGHHENSNDLLETKSIVLDLCQTTKTTPPLNFDLLCSKEMSKAIHDMLRGFSIADHGFGIDCNIEVVTKLINEVYDK